MSTITPRKRMNGTTAYTVQVKIMRDGKFVFQKSQTFDREAAARAWAKKTEAALALPGALAVTSQ